VLKGLLFVSAVTIGLAAPALILPGTRFDGFPRPVQAVGAAPWTTGIGPSSLPAGTQVAAGGTIDVNCDGIDDILLQNAAGWIGTFIMDGSGHPAEFRYIYPGPVTVRVVGTGDLNSDGISDILVLDHLNWIGGILMSCTGLPVNFFYVKPGSSSRVAGMLDLNTDGIADILLQSDAQLLIGLTLDGQGVPMNLFFVYPASTGGWLARATGDLNGDGIADIVVQRPDTYWVAALFMNGTGSPTSFDYVYVGSMFDWEVAGAADLNEDGIVDIIFQNGADWVGGFLMNGHGQAFDFIYVYPGSTDGWHVVGGR